MNKDKCLVVEIEKQDLNKKGIRCWLCAGYTDSDNIPVCVECILQEGLDLSLSTFKKLLLEKYDGFIRTE